MDEYVSCIQAVTTSALQPEGIHWALRTPEYVDYTSDVLPPANNAFGMTPPPTKDEHIAYWDAQVDDELFFKASTLEELVKKK